MENTEQKPETGQSVREVSKALALRITEAIADRKSIVAVVDNDDGRHLSHVVAAMVSRLYGQIILIIRPHAVGDVPPTVMYDPTKADVRLFVLDDENMMPFNHSRQVATEPSPACSDVGPDNHTRPK